MKNLFYSLVSAALSVGLWFGIATSIWKPLAPATTAFASTEGFRFEKTDWGTLKAIWGPQQKELYGRTRPTNEGYLIAYRTWSQLGKGRPGPVKVVYALGDTFRGYVLQDPQQLQTKFGVTCLVCRRNNVSTVITDDGVLRINSNFIFDERNGHVRIVRVIENISSEAAVELLSIQLQHAGGLLDKESPRLGRVMPARKAVAPKTALWHALPGMSANAWLPEAANVSPPCDFCPDNCDRQASLAPSQSLTYCINCNPDSTAPLGYRVSAVPVPAGSKECQHQITLGGWDVKDQLLGAPVGSTGAKTKYALICVNCPKEPGGSPTAVPYLLTRRSASKEEQAKRREELGCALGIEIERVGTPISRQNLSPQQQQSFEHTLQPQG